MGKRRTEGSKKRKNRAPIPENVSATEKTESSSRDKEERKIVLKALRKEIKQILLGSYLTLEDGSLVSGGDSYMSPLGVSEGAGSIMFFGISDRSAVYTTSMKNSKQVMFAVFKAMKNIGRAVTLETAPNAVACYIKSLVYRPVVLVFDKASEGAEERFELRGYCARSPMSFVAIRHAMGKLAKELPDSIHRV